MTKLLAKIVKYSLLPFSLMIVAKLIGVLAGAFYVGTIVEIGNDISNRYMMQLYVIGVEEMKLINRTSNLSMIIALAAGIILIIAYHKFVAEPKKKVKCKLRKKTAAEWIAEGNDGFLQLLVWLTYFLFASFIVITDYAVGSERNRAIALIGTFAFAIIVILHEKIENLLKNFYTVCYAKG